MGNFPKFCQEAGIGMMCTPGEAHWMHGSTEAQVKIHKNTMKRLRNEHPTISTRACGHVSAFASNHGQVVKGFTPIQWAYGVDPDSFTLDSQTDPLFVNRKQKLHPEGF